MVGLTFTSDAICAQDVELKLMHTSPMISASRSYQ
jgi:hypothetical protein